MKKCTVFAAFGFGLFLLSGPPLLNAAAATIVSGGLIAQYPMTNCDGTQSTSTTTLVDCSGNGYNGTLVNSPTFTSQGLSFISTNSQYVSLPAAVASSTVTIEMFADTSYQAGLGNNVEAFIGQQSPGSNVELFASPDNLNTTPAIFNGSAFDTISGPSAFNPAFITAVLDNTNDALYLNGSPVSSYHNRGGSLPQQGGQFDIGGRTNNYFFQGPIYYTLFYSRALSANEVAQNYAAVSSILTSRGVNLAPTSNSTVNSAVFLGDSITAGYGVPSSYVALATTTATFQKTNLGLSGQTLASISQNAYGTVSTKYHPLAQANVATIFAGTNDILSSTPVSTIYSTLASTSLALKASGWKVNIITTLDRNGFSSQDQSYDALIRNGWSSFADSLTDVALNPLLGAPGANASTTYFLDGTHPTTAGDELIAQQVSTVLNALTSPLLNVSSISATTTNSTATFAFSTNASSSAFISFGLTSSYSTTSPEVDTATRTFTHSITLSALPSCSVYHYSIDARQLDPSGEVKLAHNDATSTDGMFATAGCTGNASISTSTSQTISGSGSLSLGDISLSIPSSFSASTTSATFQAKKLDSTAFFASASTPGGETTVGTDVFNLSALTDATTTLSTFTTPLTVTLSYNPTNISNLQASSLTIYRYDAGTGWTPLPNCSVDTTNDTVTCTTNHFSDFALFGTPTPAATTPTTTNNGGGGVDISQTDLQAESDALRAQITAAFDASHGISATTAVGDRRLVRLSLFTTNLSYKSKGEEVLFLQRYLNSNGFPVASIGAGSSGHETTYFGVATRAAVIKFQKANGITPDIGYFGPKTRAVVNAMI